MVAYASVQYVKVRLSAEPTVIAGAVRSAVDVEHIGAGSVITTTGAPGIALITTLADDTEVHPTELVTVNVYVPGAIPLMVLLVPVPVAITPSGLRVSVHVPLAGNPLKTTLPDGTANVGWVIVPTTGAEGVAG